jgi:hypothetical protein
MLIRFLAKQDEWVCDKSSIFEVLKGFMDNLAEFPIDEIFSTTLFHCLKSRKFSPKGKICFLELVVERFEEDIELLDSQIQS